eukprot:220318-Pelagomonas_calceolata.AAC.4
MVKNHADLGGVGRVLSREGAASWGRDTDAYDLECPCSHESMHGSHKHARIHVRCELEHMGAAKFPAGWVTQKETCVPLSDSMDGNPNLGVENATAPPHVLLGCRSGSYAGTLKMCARCCCTWTGASCCQGLLMAPSSCGTCACNVACRCVGREVLLWARPCAQALPPLLSILTQLAFEGGTHNQKKKTLCVKALCGRTCHSCVGSNASAPAARSCAMCAQTLCSTHAILHGHTCHSVWTHVPLCGHTCLCPCYAKPYNVHMASV